MTKQASLHILAPREWPCLASDYLAAARLDGDKDVIYYEDILERMEFEPGVYVFTGLNRLGPVTARLFADLHAQLTASAGVTPLNHPLRTLRRYELLRMLKDEGLNEFAVFGAWEDFSSVRFPAFVRPRERDGTVPQLLHSLRAVERTIGQFLLDGWQTDELLVIEFEDVANNDGLFAKYSAFVIGDRILPVSLDISRHWVVRAAGTLSGPELVEASDRYKAENPHADQLREVFKKSGTQFGRIDYSIKCGRVQTWEINTLPTLWRQTGSQPISPELAQRRARFRAAFSGAWQETIDKALAGSAVRPVFDRQLMPAVDEEIAQRAGTKGRVQRAARFAALRTYLRPFKPILKPLATHLLGPILARRAGASRFQ